MSKNINYKHETYDLEERSFVFARRVNVYVRHLPKDVPAIENSKQLVRAAGSVGANYIEANEASSKKDFIYRIKISKKEAKEARYWLRLTEPDNEWQVEKETLVNEAMEFMKIFGAIIKKLK